MRKTYTAAFKAKIITEILREQKPLSQIAAENGIHPNLLTKWKQTALEGLPTLFERDSQSHGNDAAQGKKTAELYEQIGRLTTQVNWLKKKSGLDPESQ